MELWQSVSKWILLEWQTEYCNSLNYSTRYDFELQLCTCMNFSKYNYSTVTVYEQSVSVFLFNFLFTFVIKQLYIVELI